MACRILTYQNLETPLKVVYRKPIENKKGVQRFVSVDPLQFEYAYYTSYQYTGNNPVTFTDLDGRETTDNETTNVQTNGQQQIVIDSESKSNFAIAKEKISGIMSVIEEFLGLSSDKNSKVSEKIVENINNDKNSGKCGKEYACYPAVWRKTLTAYNQLPRKISITPTELKKTFTADKSHPKYQDRISPQGSDEFTILFSTNYGHSKWKNIPEEFRAKGAPGAFAYIGYAELVDDVWSDMKPGGVLQFWNSESDFKSLRDGEGYDTNDIPSLYARHYLKTTHTEGGHSAIFLEYVEKFGVNIGMKYVDQWGIKTEYRIDLKSPWGMVIGANLLDNKKVTKTK